MECTIVKNKALSLKDNNVDHDLDFLALTETWLHSVRVTTFLLTSYARKDTFSIILPERTQKAVELVY